MTEVGLQLYTVRDYLERDFVGTLRRVAEIGYHNLEFAGYGGMSAKELRSVADDLGLRLVSTHVMVLHDPERQLEYAKEAGFSYVVCPWLPEELRPTGDSYTDVGRRLAEIGGRARALGLTFCYHNHAFEFEKKTAAGQYGFDALYEAAPADDLKAELDVYWVARALEDPMAYIRQFGSRCPLVHLKDMADDEERSFAELGQGTLPIAAIAEAAKTAGASYLFVEQDVCKRDSLESIATSYRYLKDRGYVA